MNIVRIDVKLIKQVSTYVDTTHKSYGLDLHLFDGTYIEVQYKFHKTLVSEINTLKKNLKSIEFTLSKQEPYVATSKAILTTYHILNKEGIWICEDQDHSK